MALQLTPYHLPLVCSLVLSVAVAAFAVRNRDVPGGAPLAVFAAATAVWTAGELGNVSATGTAAKTLWTNVEITASTLVPPAFLLLALEYTGRLDGLDRRLLGALGVEPVVLSLLVWTSGHGLVRRVTGRRLADGGYWIITESLGPAFFAHVAYSYLVIGLGIALIVRTSLLSRGVYLVQGTAFVLGVAVVLVANVAYVSGLTPPGLDPTNMAFAVCSALLLAAIRSQRLLDVSPATRELARDELIATLPDAIVVLNESDQVVDANPAAQEVFDATTPDIVGEPLGAVAPPLADALADGTHMLTLERGDETRHYDLRESGLDRGYGTVTGRVVTLRDVTDRKQTEERYQTLLDRSLDIVTVIDEDGTITYETPSVEEVLGYAQPELVGESALEYVHPDDRGAIVESLTGQLAEPGSEATLEFRFLHADGSWRWLEARARNRTDDPIVDGIIVNSRDVTERKRREQQTDVMRRLLRHNLRNDMTVVEGYADLLSEAAVDSEGDTAPGDGSAADQPIAEYVDAIEERVEKVVERSDKLQRVTTQLRDDERRLVDPTAVIEETVDSVRLSHPEVTVETDLGDLPPVRAGDAFEVAFAELVENSIEHCDGEPGITVTATAEPEDVRVRISDDGPGIPVDELDPLRNREETALEHGSGVGLWLVIWVVRSVRGDLEFDVEDGTTVTLRLPRADAATGVSASDAPTDGARALSTSDE
ncbi:histidine kinase N-terminal 7TM domain-containing protein [Haloarchaeobius salinus]|uniref:histidine kinase N-terminal 7TM domain-containing protein n=1 Tax=Haloarchaeobius salinus TaxID=1198298 RepID=UPI00210C0EA8|nr:histidine kinase N-terminal 7TM domain-containing protein [Haloarchaeobius salinus]